MLHFVNFFSSDIERTIYWQYLHKNNYFYFYFIGTLVYKI